MGILMNDDNDTDFTPSKIKFKFSGDELQRKIDAVNIDVPPPRIDYEPYKFSADELQRRIDAANASYDLRIRIIDSYLKFVCISLLVSMVFVPIVIVLIAYLENNR